MARISRSHHYCCTENKIVRLAFIVGTHFQKGTAQLLQTRVSGRKYRSVQYVFGLVFQEYQAHISRKKSGTFPKEKQHVFRGRTDAFNAVRTVLLLTVLAQISRAAFNALRHRNRGLLVTYFCTFFEKGFAQKSRQH